MSITQDELNRAITKARQLEASGYFEKARQGDQKAASLFARLTAYELNPSGFSDDYGCLSKSPGESQVDGFAEDAICFGNNQIDLMNVVDLVNGAGAPGASIGGSVKERRPTNHWVKPVPLSAEQLTYLRSGGMPPTPPPTAPTYPSYEALGGDEGAKKITRVLGHDYRAAGRAGLDDECGGWLRRTDYDRLAGICKTEEESIAKHRDEWLAALGLIVSTPGMMSDSDRCLICGASVGYERGKRRPIPHTSDCTTR